MRDPGKQRRPDGTDQEVAHHHDEKCKRKGLSETILVRERPGENWKEINESAEYRGEGTGIDLAELKVVAEENYHYDLLRVVGETLKKLQRVSDPERAMEISKQLLEARGHFVSPGISCCDVLRDSSMGLEQKLAIFVQYNKKPCTLKRNCSVKDFFKTHPFP